MAGRDRRRRPRRLPGIALSDFGFVAYASADSVEWLVKEMRCGFQDPTMARFDPSDRLDIAMVTHRQWKAGKKVLVRCQAGPNR